jgi:hypothetical protein
MQTRLRRIIRSGEPFQLLAEASNIVELTTDRPIDNIRRDGTDAFTLDQMVDGLAVVDLPESTAVLLAVQTLLPPSPVRARISSEVAGRNWPLPDWVRQIDQIEIVSTAQMTDVLGDGDNILVTVRSPSGKQMTAMVYIDHNMGTLVKDAFVAPVGIEELGDSLDRSGETDINLDFIDAADARARIKQAIAEGDQTFPPFETEAWPATRPLIEWIVGHLPAGGHPYLRQEWSEEDRKALVDAFLATPEGRGIATDADEVDIVHTLIDFACDYGAGDPLRWSPVAVEIFLADWFPRKVIADQTYRDNVPDTMLLFVRYCHQERAVSDHLTRETLDAIWQWEGHTTRRGQSDPRLGFDFDPDEPFEAIMLELMAEDVGGMEILDRLDAVPLPVEEFDWTGIPDDIHDRVGEVLELTDGCCEELFDPEYRTIVRRLVARAAAADPNLFRRRAKTENTAVAFVWMIGSENKAFRYDLSVKDLRAWFGLKPGSSSQRAQTIRRAIGVADPYNTRGLADPRLLHSSLRSSLIDRRDRYRATLAELEEPETAPAPVVDVDVAMAIAWFPAAAWPDARARFGLEDMPADHADYSREIQAGLVGYATHGVRQLAVAPLDVDEVIAYARTRRVDPKSEQTRAQMSAEMYRTGRTIPWPPGRNQPCWCSSGRKYKHCCGRRS